MAELNLCDKDHMVHKPFIEKIYDPPCFKRMSLQIGFVPLVKDSVGCSAYKK